MLPPAFFRLARLRAEDMLTEADCERLFDDAVRQNRSRVVATAAVLAAALCIVAATLMLRSIFLFGGFGAS